MKFEAYSYNPFSGGGTPLENKTIELPYINNSLLTISTGQLVRSNGIVNNDGEIVIDGTETGSSSIIGFSKTSVAPTNKGHIITTGIVEKVHSYSEGVLAYLNTSTGVVSDVASSESTAIGVFLSGNRLYLQGISLNSTAGKLPIGGLTNDILIKKSGTNYDTEWASELDTLNLDTDYVPTGTEPIGSSFYDSTNRCISTVLPNSILQNGKELYTTILNQTGSTILDGQVVYVSGAVGMSDVLTGAKFIANGTINDMKVAGIATQNIANGAKGEITHFGTVRGLDTTGTPYGEVWNEGDTLYASATVAGRLTNVKPQAPNLSIKIGYVINKHTNVGSIFVQPTLKSKLTDLYDVDGTPLDTTGQIMVWDETRKVFDFTDNINTFLKTNTANSTYEKLANKNTANGYCGLDSGGKVPLQNLPSTLLKYIGTWNAETNTPSLTATDLTKVSHVYVVSHDGTQFGITWKAGDWLIYDADGVVEKSDNSDDVVSVNGKTGVVVINKADVGLSNVDNTSDLDKPISSLTQTALNLKADDLDLTAHTTNTSNPHGVTKAQIGLDNVANIDTTTTSNITDSVDKRFITDAAKDKLTATTKTTIAEITDVIETLNWSATAPYTQNITLSVEGHTITDADYDINIYRVSNATVATDKLEIEAYSYIDKAVISADNTLTLTAYDYKPLTDINIKMEVVKKW